MENKRKIHFIGIGGIGVSSLARYYAEEGFEVSGSDAVNPKETFNLKNVRVFVGHRKENVPQELDLLVYSSAVNQNNEELLEAKKRGVEIKSYPEALGELTRKYYTIAVSGTHGKSTTTAMLALVMIRAGLDPTVIIGTKMKELDNTNFRKGKSRYLLIEADEFKAALLNYVPSVAVITNIEEDHLDYYRDLDHILSTFKDYVCNNLKNGKLVLNGEDENSKKLLCVGEAEKFVYYPEKQCLKEIKLSVPGKHNIFNACAVKKVGEVLKIDKKTVNEGLLEFKGTWRRFDKEIAVIKSGEKIEIINDYAHHPTEIKATFDAIKESCSPEKVTVLFQPHQYERTYRLFSKFTEALSENNFKKVLISDIYTVKGRESEEIKKKVSAKKLAQESVNTEYIGSLKDAEKYLLKNLQEGEILVIIGAGDVYNLGGHIKKKV